MESGLIAKSLMRQKHLPIGPMSIGSLVIVPNLSLFLCLIAMRVHLTLECLLLLSPIALSLLRFPHIVIKGHSAMSALLHQGTLLAQKVRVVVLHLPGLLV